MTQDGPVEIILKVDRATGTLIEVRKTNEVEIEFVDPEEAGKIYKSSQEKCSG